MVENEITGEPLKRALTPGRVVLLFHSIYFLFEAFLLELRKYNKITMFIVCTRRQPERRLKKYNV